MGGKEGGTADPMSKMQKPILASDQTGTITTNLSEEKSEFA